MEAIHNNRAGAAAPPTAGWYPWYVVLVLMLAQTFSFIDRMIMGLLVEPVRASFGISDTQYSLLAGMAFAVFYAVMGLPLARIADRYSRRWLISIGIAVWSVMTALCGLAQSFWGLFLARVGVGVGEASLSPAAYSMITDYFPRGVLARALSLYTVGVTIGSGLAYMIGAEVVAYVESLGEVIVPLIGRVEGWQATFLAVGLPGVLVAVLMLATVREPERKGGLASAGQGIPVAEVVAFVAARKRAFLCHILGMSAYIMVVFSLNVWGPTYLMRGFGFAPSTAGWITGMAMMIGGTVGLLSGGLIADRWFSRGNSDAYSQVIMITAACLLPFAVAMGFVTDPTLAVACLSLAIFFSAFQGGISGGVIQLMTPNQMRGQAVALYFLGANLLGLGLGPTVVAATTDYVFQSDAALGKSIALVAAVLVPLALAVMLYGARARREAILEAQQWS
ncbi:spinster family MFS transporter [Parahaliea mediterranea]|uniref:spinster family MFS transporter n=1 Tax=Parahaliea mediterranea TaxID=651086 RepID=UPI00130096A9|nr:MFS transporter [Parahaliea mediterranea]